MSRFLRNILDKQPGEGRAPLPETPPLPETLPLPETVPSEKPPPPEEIPGSENTTPTQNTTPPVIGTPTGNATPNQKSRRTPTVSRRPPPESRPLPETPLLPWNEPHLRQPHAVREVLRTLKPGPRAILDEIYRACAGWHSDECTISLTKLSNYCQLDIKQVRAHLLKLEAAGHIKRLGDVVGGRDIDMRGVRFRCFLPRMETPPKNSTPPEIGRGPKTPPNKRTALNETQFKNVDPPSEEISEEERERLQREYEEAQRELRRGEGV